MLCTSVDLGTAPMTVSILLPPLKIMMVGMLRMPYSVATPGDSSVLLLFCLFVGVRAGGAEAGVSAFRPWGATSGPAPGENKTQTHSLKHLSLSPYSAASSSTMGAIMRQGPHQGLFGLVWEGG